ncbi:MAG: hypothetical protein ACRD2L_25180 [Terriglobia bacterium]
MEEKKLMKELRQIRNLLILLAIKAGATTNDIGEITGIGATNISALFPQRPGKGKKGTGASEA